MSEEAMVTQMAVLSMQVCVPADWTDEQVKTFADAETLCGTPHGWGSRRQGDKALMGHNERVPCEKREGFVHIMLDA